MQLTPIILSSKHFQYAPHKWNHFTIKHTMDTNTVFCFYLYQGTLHFRQITKRQIRFHYHKETRIQHHTQDKGITFKLLLYEEADSANYHYNQCHWISRSRTELQVFTSHNSRIWIVEENHLFRLFVLVILDLLVSSGGLQIISSRLLQKFL